MGTATSRVATLTVADPFISAQPIGQTAYSGQMGIFWAYATGTFPLSYQWQKDGVDLPGETGSALWLTNVQRAAQGAYDVVISSSYGTVTSSLVSLAVYLGAR